MKKYLYSLFLILTFVTANAQEKVLKGSFKALKDIAAYNVIFDYTGQKIAHFKDEEAFLKDKMGKRNGEKAQDFRKRWYDDRENKYEPAFIDYFNERMKGKATVAKDASQKYTILIKTNWIYPGYNVGIGAQESKISAVMTVYETANPDNILLEVEYDKSIGIAPDHEKNAYDSGDRIAGAYEKLAKNFTLQLKRFM